MEKAILSDTDRAYDLADMDVWENSGRRQGRTGSRSVGGFWRHGNWNAWKNINKRRVPDQV